MNKICIIPARGGSKRIPRKNIKHFLGKPIIAYSIECALSSGIFDEVMVSTDDEEIASVARSYGASVPFMRSALNANDYASTVDVLIEVVDSYRQHNRLFDAGCCVYPTSPLATVSRIKEGFNKLSNASYDTVFPIVRFSYPIWRGLQVSEGKVRMIWPENMPKRSQDLSASYHDAGQWYWFNTQVLAEKKQLWTENTHGIEIDELECQDIDTEMDWRLAELKYALLQGN